MRPIPAIGTALLLIFFPSGEGALAKTRVEFVQRIMAAYQSADRQAALKRLFRLEGVDAESLKTYDGIVSRLSRRQGTPTVGFEPLPPDFKPIYVRDGYEYRPNLKLLGYVVLNGKTRLPYGLHNGRHFFPGTRRTAVNPGGPADRLVQMMVVGLASPPAKFQGFCDVMQSNGKAKRMTLQDEGRGNMTSALMAQHIVRCEITNTGRRGRLWVRLQEGDRVILDRKIDPPELTFSYRR